MRSVTVSIGRSAPPSPAGAAGPASRAGLCLLGVAPPGFPPVSDRVPATLIRRSRHPQGGPEVEAVRLSRGFDPALLPGLPQGSRLRDAAVLALVGAPALELFLVHGAAPGVGLADAAVFGALEPFLDELPGALVAIPDAAGPPVVGPAPLDLEATAARLERVLRRYAGAWRQRYQVGFIGLPPELSGAALRRQGRDVDALLVTWAGPGAAAHAWRDAGAALAGLAAPLEVIHAIDRRRMALPPGRPLPDGRAVQLGLEPGRCWPDVEAPVVALRVAADGRGARVVGEASLRAPVGEWGLPALRTVKTLHRLMMQTAEAFVFRPVDTAQAISLMTALDYCVRPFATAGLLVGPGGVGAPSIDTAVERNPAAPGLSATVSAQLRPWCRELRIRVGVQERARARVEIGTGGVS